MPDIKQILGEYVSTVNSGKYSSLDEVNSKFPELSAYDKNVLGEYVATVNSGKYNSLDEVNSKFPELFDVKKKTIFSLLLERIIHITECNQKRVPHWVQDLSL